MLTMLEVIKKLKLEFKLKLVVIGKFSSKETEKIFCDTLRNYSIQSEVDYKGYLPHEEAIKNLLQANTLDFFYKRIENDTIGESPQNISNTLLQGLPTIMSDFPAKRDLIEKNKNGFVIPANKKI